MAKAIGNYEKDYGEFLKNLRRINALLELKQEQLSTNGNGIDDDDSDDNDDEIECAEEGDEDFIEEEVEADDDDGDDGDDDDEYQVIDDEAVYNQEWSSTSDKNDMEEDINNNNEENKEILPLTLQDKKLLRPNRVFASLPNELFNNVTSTTTLQQQPPTASANTSSYRPRWNLRDFEVGKEIGRGFYAIAYRARLKMDRPIVFVLKVLEKVQYRLVGGFYQILREIKNHSKLRHPNVVRFYDFVQDQKRIYLLIELCPYGDLMNYIRQCGPLSEPAAWFVFNQLVKATVYCHKAGVIHREIKPENVYIYDIKTITETGEKELTVKLGDFSCSAVLSYDDNATKKERKRSSICGTKEYFAPEMIEAGEHDSRVDTWCLGVFLFEILVSHTPFENDAETEEELYELIRCKRDLPFPSTLSSDVITLINDLLEKDVDKRPSLELLHERYSWFSPNSKCCNSITI
eukprot:TRINITY_DN10070_c0_g3_i2.p1 TRINITY_DN10070_c0_g3~~TRINITY_DN10070_c0_g3_i2.p1  ORF type:complete len:462 (+),score=145.90 TRINITY_DN10070_c0_g3_i2:435-1820(+)